MELSILQYVAYGKTNQDLADIFDSNILTIKNHFQHIAEKLGTQNRAAALWQAIATGQMPPPEVKVPTFEKRAYNKMNRGPARRPKTNRRMVKSMPACP